MLSIKSTENLAGVTISGDYNDLYNLVDAFHMIAVYEDTIKNQRYVEMSIRMLSVCYDVRHAYQGDREVELVENGMDDSKKKSFGVIASKKNVYYKCNVLYPEMFFNMLALNELVKLRIKEISKIKYIYDEVFSKNVIWDDTIATIRSYQAAFAKCVKETISDSSFTRWLKIMNDEIIGYETIATQFLDVVNLQYIDMTKENRLKNLNKIAKRLAVYYADEEHNEIKSIVVSAAKARGCSSDNIKLSGTEYPEEIVW